MYNNDIESNSEMWILGMLGSIENHLKDQEKYSRETPEAVSAVNAYMEKTIQLKQLT